MDKPRVRVKSGRLVFSDNWLQSLSDRDFVSLCDRVEPGADVDFLRDELESSIYEFIMDKPSLLSKVKSFINQMVNFRYDGTAR